MKNIKPEITLTKAQRKAIEQYSRLIPEYKQLGREVKKLIKSILNKTGIEFIEIIGRVKKINSFKDKIIRKNYKNPLLDAKDLCAIRIICNFPEDMKKIKKALKEKFSILAHKNQEKNISPYKFWYRSHHFKIRLNDDQISRENYKLLKHFIVETQVRTVFMDAWARMEHEINYKHKWNTSHATKRKLSRLSAILELADEQIQELVKNTKDVKSYNRYYQKFKIHRINKKKLIQRPFT